MRLYFTYQHLQNTGYYALLCALFVTGGYLLAEVLFLLALDFPFNLYEPEVVMEAWQLAHGGTIYNNPEIGPHAGLYAPFYQLTGALLFQFLPESLLTLRALSFISLVMIAFFTWKISSHQNLMQFLFILLLIMMWHPNLLFFDLHAKPDSYSLFWVFGAIYLLIIWVDRAKLYYGIAASICLILAFYTKQTMLFVFVGSVAALLLQQEFRKAILLAGITILLGVSAWFIFKDIAGDYLYFYLFELPGSFNISYGQLAGSFYRLITEPWFLLAIYFMFRDFYKNRWHFLHTLLAVLLVLSLAACTLTAAKDGGLANAYQPFYLLTSLFVGIRIPVAALFRSTSPHFNMNARKGLTALTFLIALLLLGTISLNPAQYYSRIQNRINSANSYHQLARDLQNAEGDVFVPYDNYLSLKAGKPVFWSYKSERDLYYSSITPKMAYRELARKHRHVVTVHIANYENSMQLIPFIKDHGYIPAQSYPMDQAITYKWWKKEQQ